MRSKRKIQIQHFFSLILAFLVSLLPLVESLFFSAMYTSLVWLFLFLCKAEGSSTILLVWSACSSLLLFGSFRVGATSKFKKFIHYFFMGCAIIAISLGALILLMQLGATQRSFAEAWLEYARSNGPYGFFSFFAGEIYALLLLISIWFIARKQYFTGLCVAITVNALCGGIILDNQLLLALSVLFIVIPLLRKGRWQSFIFPSFCTALLAILIACMGTSTGVSPSSVIYIDTSNIMATFFPDFPLLVSVPGYGYSVNAIKPEKSVTLSSHPVLYLSGKPEDVVYLPIAQYSSWDGSSWHSNFRNTARVADTEKGMPYVEGESDETNEPAQVTRVSKTIITGRETLSTEKLSYLRSGLTIRVLEDFYSIIPCTLNTYAVKIPESLEDVNISEHTSGVLTVSKGMQRNTEIALYQCNLNEQNAQDVCPENFKISEIEEHGIAFTQVPMRIQELADSMYKQAKQIVNGNTTLNAPNSSENVSSDENVNYNEYVKREYISLVLDYLSDGFTYSLKSSTTSFIRDPFEYFMFESKTGFCTWFSGSFTLMMLSQSIPCRLTEGFRVALDEHGEGAVTGMQAHAWAEVFIDGQWRIFEPTPVYTSDDPFAYVKLDDKRTRRQLTSAISDSDLNLNLSSKRKIYISPIVFIVGVALLLVAVLTLVIIAIIHGNTPSRKLNRLAHRLVAKYARRGVLSPTVTGWIEWKQSVLKSCNTEVEQRTALIDLEIADRIINYLYNNLTNQ